MNPLFLIGGAAAAAYWLLGREKAPGAGPVSVSPSGTGPAPGFEHMSFEPPPSSGSGRLWVQTLPQMATAERDFAIYTAITQGFTPPMQWTAVTSEKNGKSITFMASNGPLMVGTSDPIAVNVGHRTAQLLADFFGCVLPTSRMSDLAWIQGAAVNPQTQTPDAHMGDTSRMVQHSDALHKAMLLRNLLDSDLVRPVGKDWINSERLVRPDGSPSPCTLQGGGFIDGTIAGCNFGWHVESAASESPGHIPVHQSPGLRHDFDYRDYSQTVTLYQEMAQVDGMGSSHIEAILADPEWAHLLSDEVAPGKACRCVRHPAVPRGSAVA